MRFRYFLVPLLLASAVLGCSEEPAGPVLLVTSSRPYLGGAVSVDGLEWGQIGEYDFNTGILGVVTKTTNPDSPLKDVVGLNMFVEGLSSGTHEVLIRKAGMPDLSVQFKLPFRSEEQLCWAMLSPTYTNVGDECSIGSTGR